MYRFLVERAFPAELAIPGNTAGAAFCRQVVAQNARYGVTWLHSFVSMDLKAMVCLYEGPSDTAIRAAANRNALPVNRLIPVTILDPYFYTGAIEPVASTAQTGR
jgi:hypothetical protein